MVTKTQSIQATEKDALDPETKSNDSEEVLGAKPEGEETQEHHSVSDSLSAEPDQSDEETEKTTDEKEAVTAEEYSLEETMKNQKADHSDQDLNEEKRKARPLGCNELFKKVPMRFGLKFCRNDDFS